jgi:hypothetical protein
VSGAAVGGSVPRIPAAALERQAPAPGYDALVYGVGGHPEDAAARAIAARHPGILWLHDVQAERFGLDVPTDLLLGARSVVVRSESHARWLRLALGGGPLVPLHVVGSADPAQQADELLRLVAAATRGPDPS